MEKLQWCVDFTNNNDATLLISGDVFDKPSVADYVKTDVIAELKRLKNIPIVIYGNHDILWASEERNYRTSLAVLESAGIVKVLKDDVDLGEVILTKRKPLLTADKPQIMLFHGFLNQEDGVNTLLFADIQCDSKALVLLGHDHVVYDDVDYKGATIIRPGSFTRAIRTDAADRIPEIVLIDVKDGSFETSKHPILAAKQVELIFKSKRKGIEKSKVSYDSIIAQLKQANQTDASLTESLKLVTDSQEVIGYIDNAVNEVTLKQNK
jgi:DNA repair exonuclease SbcCD nuclease subunit